MPVRTVLLKISGVRCKSYPTTTPDSELNAEAANIPIPFAQPSKAIAPITKDRCERDICYFSPNICSPLPWRLNLGRAPSKARSAKFSIFQHFATGQIVWPLVRPNIEVT
jgi:hypothetical protein